MKKSYEFLDSGNMKRLEKFQDYILIRPCAQAVWAPTQEALWDQAHATFSREGKNTWEFHKKMPTFWDMDIEGVKLQLTTTDFGHLGTFPEHCNQLTFMKKHFLKKKNPKILNLFAYTGLSSLVLAKEGAEVTHLDASKKAVQWAKDNAKLSDLENAPIRYITEDVLKFLKREQRREAAYDGILLDPPSFGRGTKNEVFKIEEHLLELLELCKSLLSKNPLFIVFTCHTPGFTCQVLENLMKQVFGKNGQLESGEMLLTSEKSYPLPLGAYARISYES